MTGGSSRGGEGVEEIGELLGEAGGAQEDLKGEDSEVAVDQVSL
jgi:hypothetical protein